jgi:hypothetical protein
MSLNPEQIIRRLNLEEAESDPRWDNQPKHVYRGHRMRHGKIYADPTGDWCFYDKLLKAGIFDDLTPDKFKGWQYVEGWNDGPYRVVWVNFELRATFTYCEGDLTLVVCDDDATFKTELLDCGECYKHGIDLGPLKDTVVEM